MWMRQTIGEQRKVLTALFEPTLQKVAQACVIVWDRVDQLDQALAAEISLIPHCNLLYAVDKEGKQISSNVNAHDIDSSYRGQDLSQRPYAVSLYPKRHFMLSSIYISQVTGKPCISAVQPVNNASHFLGFLVADFDLRHIPLNLGQPHEHEQEIHTQSYLTLPDEPTPAPVFSPQRRLSKLDRQLGDAIHILDILMRDHGIFHCALHLGGDRVLLWHVSNPYFYQVHTTDELLDNSMFNLYPHTPYSEQAHCQASRLKSVLERFRVLRLIDDTFYLQTASLNWMNGMVGLVFSTDGYCQYFTVEQFLSKDIGIWQPAAGCK